MTCKQYLKYYIGSSMYLLVLWILVFWLFDSPVAPKHSLALTHQSVNVQSEKQKKPLKVFPGRGNLTPGNPYKGVRRSVGTKRRKLVLVIHYRGQHYPETRDLLLPPGWSQEPVLTTALTLLELHHVWRRRLRSICLSWSLWRYCCFCC